MYVKEKIVTLNIDYVIPVILNQNLLLLRLTVRVMKSELIIFQHVLKF